MFRLNITKAMITFIKENRDSHNMNASELATAIGKSSAYISKLDKGDYKTISYEDFCQMLDAICRNEDEGKKLVDNFLTDYIRNKTDETEPEEDYGLTTYDDVFRLLEIPPDLVDYINEEISKNKFEISEIVNKANINGDLPDFAKNPKYENNVYYPYEKEDSQEESKKPTESFIKVNIQEAHVSDILNKTITNTNYITLQALLYTIYRLQNIGKSLSSLAAETFLDKFNFNNLEGIKYSESAKKSKTKVHEEMTNMPSLFVKTVNDFADIAFTFFKRNSIYAIAKIGGFRRNLYTDPAFTIALLDLPFYKLKDLDRDDKKKLINEIEQLTLKYSEKKPDHEYETY